MPHPRTSPRRKWRQITPLRLLLVGAVVAAVTFSAAQALATSGSGAVSTYMARGPVIAVRCDRSPPHRHRYKDGAVSRARQGRDKACDIHVSNGHADSDV